MERLMNLWLEYYSVILAFLSPALIGSFVFMIIKSFKEKGFANKLIDKFSVKINNIINNKLQSLNINIDEKIDVIESKLKALAEIQVILASKDNLTVEEFERILEKFKLISNEIKGTSLMLEVVKKENEIKKSLDDLKINVEEIISKKIRG